MAPTARRFPPDPESRPRSAAARDAVLALLAGGPRLWTAVAEEAARAAGIQVASVDTLIAAACKAGEISWTGTAARGGRTLHLGLVAGAGVTRPANPRRVAAPAPLPPWERVEGLFRQMPDGARVREWVEALYRRDGVDVPDLVAEHMSAVLTELAANPGDG